MNPDYTAWLQVPLPDFTNLTMFLNDIFGYFVFFSHLVHSQLILLDRLHTNLMHVRLGPY